MLISDVLSAKGHDVVKVRPFAHVVTAVRKLAEFRIGALVVESQWMRPIGIFSERDFVNAIARDGAAGTRCASRHRADIHAAGPCTRS